MQNIPYGRAFRLWWNGNCHTIELLISCLQSENYLVFLPIKVGMSSISSCSHAWGQSKALIPRWGKHTIANAALVAGKQKLVAVTSWQLFQGTILPSVPREIIFVWKFVMKEYLKKKRKQMYSWATQQNNRQLLKIMIFLLCNMRKYKFEKQNIELDEVDV